MLLWRYDIDVNVQACDGRRMITGAYGENALIEAVMYRRYAPVSFYNIKDGLSKVFLLRPLKFHQFHFSHSIARSLVLRRDICLDVVDERDRTPLIMATQYG